MPIPGVQMSPFLMCHDGGVTTMTDAKGRFEILGYKKATGENQLVTARPLAASPYISSSVNLPRNVTADVVNIEVNLAGAIELSGKITDRATGKAPRQALVKYYPEPSNDRRAGLNMPASSSQMRPDGSYALAVLPGPGIISVVASPRYYYAQAAVDFAALGPSYGPPGTLEATHAIVRIDPAETTRSLVRDIELGPAVILRGTVVGYRGEQLRNVECSGLNELVRETEFLEDGSFTVTGVGARGERDLYFRHRPSNSGRVCRVRGVDRGPLKVELAPCGSVFGRLSNLVGKPLPNFPMWFIASDYRSEVTIERLRTDEAARFRANLLPGLVYSLLHGPSQNPGEIEVHSNEISDLGDLRCGLPVRPAQERITVAATDSR